MVKLGVILYSTHLILDKPTLLDNIADSTNTIVQTRLAAVGKRAVIKRAIFNTLLHWR